MQRPYRLMKFIYKIVSDFKGIFFYTHQHSFLNSKISYILSQSQTYIFMVLIILSLNYVKKALNPQSRSIFSANMCSTSVIQIIASSYIPVANNRFIPYATSFCTVSISARTRSMTGIYQNLIFKILYSDYMNFRNKA